MPSIPRKIFFISDLHLHENLPKITEQFCSFLQQVVLEGEKLYILGDFFDLWVGDDSCSPFHQYIIDLLNKAAESGLQIYFMHGNRDFLVGKNFLRAAKCRLLPEEEKILLGAIPVLLMHGDTLCLEDKNYLRMRKIFQLKLLQKIFLAMPKKWRENIADKIKQKSHGQAMTKMASLMDVTQDAVDRVMNVHEVKVLIHGHTHLPACHQWQYQHSERKRYVLQAWHDGPNALVFDGQGLIEFLKF